MTIKEIMNRGVISVEPDADIVSVAAQMADSDVGCVPVVENGRVEGMLTDRDIVLRCVAEGRDPMLCTAADIMTRAAAWVDADAPVSVAAERMGAEQVRRLPVLENGRLAGMVSLGDLARCRHGAETAEALAEIARPFRIK